MLMHSIFLMKSRMSFSSLFETFYLVTTKKKCIRELKIISFYTHMVNGLLLQSQFITLCYATNKSPMTYLLQRFTSNST